MHYTEIKDILYQQSTPIPAAYLQGITETVSSGRPADIEFSSRLPF